MVIKSDGLGTTLDREGLQLLIAKITYRRKILLRFLCSLHSVPKHLLLATLSKRPRLVKFLFISSNK